MDLKNSLFTPLVLLVVLTFTIFIVPFAPLSSYAILYRLFFTALVLISVFVLEKERRLNLALALMIIVIKWIIILCFPELENHYTILQIIFFLWIMGKLLLQTASLTRPTGLIIIDSINGYFLLALASALLIGVLNYFVPGSFSFSVSVEKPISGLNDYIYYALVVFTTTGFGDIVPLTPKAKSVSNLVSVSGQLYVTIVMALLIGHYISTREKGQ